MDSGHDKPESAVTINQNGRSRSAGMTGHDKPESPVTTNRNDRSRSTGIRTYYQARVIEAKPDALLGQSLNGLISEVAASRWLNGELVKVFPSAKTLIQEMKLDERYKDVTFETLNRKDFLESVKDAFPNVDWDRAYSEFKAAGQSESEEPKAK